MSFWSGVVQGVESNIAEREREQAREDRLKSEDKVEAFRNKQWSNTLSQQAIANRRAEEEWNRSEARYQDEQERLRKAAAEAAKAAKAAAKQVALEFNLEEAKFQHLQDRDIIGDLKVAREEHAAALQQVFDNEITLYNRDIALANLERAQAQFKEDMLQRGITNDQWERSQLFDVRVFEAGEARADQEFEFKVGETTFGRKIKMLELTESMTKAFRGQGGAIKNTKAPSAEDMNAATINIRSELGGKQGIDNLGKADREFFETVMSDPAAAHGIYAFVQTQRVKEGNKISILDLPKYINLAGMIEAKGDPDAAERLRSEILGGDPNIDNIDSLIKGVRALREYKPAEVVWGVLKAPKKSQDYSADIELFEKAIANMAAARVATLDKKDPEYQLLYEAIDYLKDSNKSVRARGSNALFDVLGVELLKEMGMEDNPAFSYKLREHEAREAALRQERMIRLQEQTSKVPEDMPMPGLGEESSGMPDRSVKEFTREEAEAFMGANPDFRGQLRVDGQLMSNEGDGSSLTAPEGLGGPEQDALPEVPAEVKEAIKSVITQGTEAEVEQAKQEIADEFGEEVAAVLFDDAKSARGTGKSAMMDGLQ